MRYQEWYEINTLTPHNCAKSTTYYTHYVRHTYFEVMHDFFRARASLSVCVCFVYYVYYAIFIMKKNGWIWDEWVARVYAVFKMLSEVLSNTSR